MTAKNSKQSYLTICILLCALLACQGTLPAASPATSAPELDANAINTYIAQTAQSALTMSAVPPPTETVSPLPALTSTSTPTASATQTETPTAAYTFTPAIPIISVSTNTNCRSGPGKVYDYEGALMVGEIAEVFGRDPTGNYWYIRNPENPNGYCWVWDEYATVSGAIAFLPVYTPPPTPTPTNTPTPTATPLPAPDFQISYASMDTCTGWWLEFKIKNIGYADAKSVEIEVLDNTAGKTVINITDGFTDINGCLSTTTRDSLSPGASAIISSPAFTFDPTGHDLIAKVTICSKTGLNGYCKIRKLKFTP